MTNEDRLQNLQKQREEFEAMIPDPQQLANEQSLELQAQTILSTEKLTAAVARLEAEMPKKLTAAIQDGQAREAAAIAQVQRQIATTLAGLPKDRSGDIQHSIHVWASVCISLMLAGFSIVVILHAR